MKIQCRVCGEMRERHALDCCRSCYRKERYLSNPEPYKQKSRKWYHKNPEKSAEASRKWKRNNPERYREISRQSSAKYSKERLGINSTGRRNKKRSCKAIAEYNALWKLENPERIREYRIKRRAGGKIKKGVVSQVLNENIFKYGIITCEKCNIDCEEMYHVDHIIPISKSGTNEKGNLQILCQQCNLRKHVDIVNYKGKNTTGQLYLN